MARWGGEAQRCKDEDALIDHQKANNPIQSRYGEDWLNNLKCSTMMSPYVCVTDMIENIIEDSKRHLKESSMRITVFYHYALALMTAKETMIWMKEQKGYYDRWILPANGLNTEEALKAYAGCPIGNSPKMMP
jgi:hypothetical protein